MAEVIKTVAYATGGLVFGTLVVLPFYNAIASTREKYADVIRNFKQ